MLDYDIAKLAQRLEGWSCADCMQLVAEAASRPVAVLRQATHFQPVHKGWGADAAYVVNALIDQPSTLCLTDVPTPPTCTRCM